MEFHLRSWSETGQPADGHLAPRDADASSRRCRPLHRRDFYRDVLLRAAHSAGDCSIHRYLPPSLVPAARASIPTNATVLRPPLSCDHLANRHPRAAPRTLSPDPSRHCSGSVTDGPSDRIQRAFPSTPGVSSACPTKNLKSTCSAGCPHIRMNADAMG